MLVVVRNNTEAHTRRPLEWNVHKKQENVTNEIKKYITKKKKKKKNGIFNYLFYFYLLSLCLCMLVYKP